MGCAPSKRAKDTGKSKGIIKPKWTSDEPLTEQRLQSMVNEFWDTAPHYGGDRVIWDALKAAVEAEDPETAELITQSAGIVVTKDDLSVCYDERGSKYELPKYVLSAPSNLIRERKQRSSLQQIDLVSRSQPTPIES